MVEVKQGYKVTKVGVIPEDWDLKDLKDIAKFSNGKAHEQYIDENGDFILVNSKFISTEGRVFKTSFVSLSPLSVDEIAMVMSDIPNGKALAKCFLVKEANKYTLNQRICSIKSEDCKNDFLFWILNRNKYFLAFDSGTGQTNLRKQDVLGCPIALPPLPEQQLIAQALSDVDSLITSLEKLISKKRDIKTATMQQLLTGKKRLPSFGEGKGYKDTEIGRIPEDWDVVKFEELRDKSDKWSITGGPFGSNLKSSDYSENGIRIIQLQNIGDSFFKNDYQIFTTTKKADELISCNIYPKEIILSKMGDPVARACIVPNYETRYVMCSDGIRLKVSPNLYDSYFIFTYLNSNYFRKRAIEASTGSTRQRIGLNELKSLLTIAPSLPEQQAIAQVLSDMDTEISQLETRLEKTNAIKQGMMQELLTGRTRLV